MSTVKKLELSGKRLKTMSKKVIEKTTQKRNNSVLIAMIIILMGLALLVFGEYECKRADKMFVEADNPPWTYEKEKERLATEIFGVYLRSGGFVFISLGILVFVARERKPLVITE